MKTRERGDTDEVKESRVTTGAVPEESSEDRRLSDTILIAVVRRNSKSRSEYFDPCQELAGRSIACLNRNGGDRKMCSDYFE